MPRHGTGSPACTLCAFVFGCGANSATSGDGSAELALFALAHAHAGHLGELVPACMRGRGCGPPVEAAAWLPSPV